MILTSELLGLCMSKYPYKFKLVCTFCVYYLYVILGIILFLPPTALIDLTYILGTSMVVSYNSMTLKYVAYCLGSISCK